MPYKNPFKGFGVALATPFDENGGVDVAALQKLVSETIAAGADFLCVLGTTAETPTLTAEERALVMHTVVKTNAGRVPLLLGAGGNNTADVCRHVQDVPTADFQGVLIVCPFYNKPSQEGLYQHFKAVSEKSPLPVVLYNVPGRTGCNLQPKTVLRIAHDCPNVVAIKEASGRITQAAEILAHSPEGFDVISGDDGITMEMLAAGACGVISVIGNAYPKSFGNMVHSVLQGHLDEARVLHHAFRNLYPLMAVDGNPAGVKCLMSLQGKMQDKLRLPLVPASAETRHAIKEFVDSFNHA